MIKCKDFFKISIILTVFLFGTLAAAPAGAVPLNLLLNDYPDIFSTGISVSYNASTDAFSAIGNAISLDDDGADPLVPIFSGSFTLTATIDASGVLAPGGTLAISGTVPTDMSGGTYSGSLLSGSLTAFGFGGENDPFEFLFTVTGGAAADLWGDTGGVILHDHYFPGSFDDGWSSLFPVGTSDTGTPIPEPATMLLLGSGLIGLAGLRRKRK